METEARIQQEIVMWFRNKFGLIHHNPKCLIFSVPNESENKNENIYKKSIGLLSGVSDLIVVLPNKIIFVEVKTEIGKQSKNQISFENDVKNLGFEYILVRSKEEFIEAVEHLNINLEK